MELEVLGRIVQRWWLAIAAALLLGGVIGYGFAQSRTPVYQAGADVLVGPLSADSSVLRAAGQTAQTYAELASASSTIDTVELALGDPRVQDVTVTATASDVTRILKVRVRGEDADLVAGVANGVAAELERVAGVEQADAPVAAEDVDPNVARVGEIRVLEAATPPSNPISPNKQLITALGALAMMVAAAVAVIAYEYTRQAVRLVGDVNRMLPGKVFGQIERSWVSDAGSPQRIAVLSNEHGPTATGLRGLSLDIVSQLPSGSPNRAVVVTGLDDRDRSGDVAINVAAALAATGRRVALIDANESTGEVLTRLVPACEPPAEPLAVGIDRSAKLILEGRYRELEAPRLLDLYSTEMDRLPEAHDVAETLEDLDAVYDHVVLHTAPAYGSPTATRWASVAAGSVLVVESEVATAQTLERCALTLARGARHFIGVVFDERPPPERRGRLLRRLFGGGGRSKSPAPTRPRPAASTASAIAGGQRQQRPTVAGRVDG